MIDSDLDSIVSIPSSIGESSCTDIEINNLQEEILKQSTQIKQFIMNTKSTEDNPSYGVLKALFALFKKELEINLALRKLYKDDRIKIEQINCQTNKFFEELHNIGYVDANSFDEILGIIQFSIKQQKKLKKYKSCLKEETAEQEKLVKTLEKIHNQTQIKEGEFELQLAELNATKDSLIIENRELRKDLESKAKELEWIKHTSNAREAEIQKRLSQSYTIEKELMMAKSTITDLEKRNNERDIQFASTKARLEELTSKIECDKSEYESKINQMHKDHHDEVSILKKKIKKLKSQMSSGFDSQIKVLDEHHNEIINDLETKHQKQLQILKNEIQQKELIIQEQADTMQQMEQTMKDFENQKVQAEQVDISNRQKYQKLMKKVQLLSEQLEEVNQYQSEKLAQMQKSTEKREAYFKDHLEATYSSKIEKLKLLEKDLRIKNGDLLNDNKRLRDQLRQYSYIIEQNEAKIAELETGAQMKNI